MFIVVSRYSAPLEEIDALMPEHRQWLAPLYESGLFILSGRSVPRTGGVMVARGTTRAELDGILATDPFRKAGLLEHAVFEFAPTQWHPDLAWLKE